MASTQKDTAFKKQNDKKRKNRKEQSRKDAGAEDEFKVKRQKLHNLSDSVSGSSPVTQEPASNRVNVENGLPSMKQSKKRKKKRKKDRRIKCPAAEEEESKQQQQVQETFPLQQHGINEKQGKKPVPRDPAL
jgi:hypothetical protein